MLSRAETRSLNECDECAASTDSRKLRESGVDFGMLNGVGFAPDNVHCEKKKKMYEFKAFSAYNKR